MAKSKNEEFSEQLAALARVAKALSHPARLTILETLAKRNSCVCGEIVEVMPLAQSTVSQHLRELKNAGLISGEISGLTSCYCVNASAITSLEKEFSKFFKNISRRINSNNCC